jgi:hypothetical protein
MLLKKHTHCTRSKILSGSWNAQLPTVFCSNLLTSHTRWHLQCHTTFSVIQRCVGLLWNTKIHYRVNKRSLAPDIRIMHTPSRAALSKIHFNNILPSAPRSCEWSFTFRLSEGNFTLYHMPQPSQPPLVYNPNNTYSSLSSFFSILLQLPDSLWTPILS